MIIVTGMPRSGTTFVGRLLAETKQFSYLHEPLHAERGIEGISNWFPFIPMDAGSADPVATSIASLIACKARYKRPLRRPGTKSALLHLASHFIHSRSHWDYLMHQLRWGRRDLLLKDASLALCTAWILKNYPTSKAVIMIRHPVAVALSMRKMNWRFDDRCLWDQPCLVERFLVPHGIPRTMQLDHDVQVAWAWRTIYSILQEQLLDIDPNRYLFVRHVDVCLQAHEFGKKIVEFSGGRMTPAASRFLDLRTDGENVSARPGKVHDLSRNSRKLVDSWKRSANPNMISVIMGIAEPVFSMFYPNAEEAADSDCDSQVSQSICA